MKSVLVIDTPKDCGECQFCKWELGQWQHCTIVDKDIRGKDCYKSYKPYWCPLVQLPEKYVIKDISCDRFYDWEYEYGYNACIDEILGGKNEDI